MWTLGPRLLSLRKEGSGGPDSYRKTRITDSKVPGTFCWPRPSCPTFLPAPSPGLEQIQCLGAQPEGAKDKGLFNCSGSEEEGVSGGKVTRRPGLVQGKAGLSGRGGRGG